MRYFRVSWVDATGAARLSDPLCTWIDAMAYRADLIAAGADDPQLLHY